MRTGDPRAQRVNPLGDRRLGLLLEFPIECRKHFQAARVEEVISVLVLNVLTNCLGEVGRPADAFLRGLKSQIGLHQAVTNFL